MKIYRQWEIWEVEWKHEDGTSKQRPALLISDTNYNLMHDELRFMKITNKEYRGYNYYCFSKDDPAFAITGLSKTCYLYPALVQNISKKKIISRRGCLNNLTKFAIDRTIKEICKNKHFPY
ncbi:MAG: type II toxin-antitoxin system PemK/MazF family toxin [Planctomycetota bacterium]